MTAPRTVEELDAELQKANATIEGYEAQLFELSRPQDHGHWTEGGMIMIGDHGEATNGDTFQVAIIDGPAATVQGTDGVIRQVADCAKLLGRDRLPRG